MTLVLEDGSNPDGANSYATETMADDYCEARGLTDWVNSTDDKEAALIRATAAIDARYGASFPGDRANGRDQNLLWPRSSAYDVGGWLIPADEIPIEVINATIEAAVRELAVPGSMMPDLKRGGAIQSVTAGSVSVTYAANASPNTAFNLIDGIISGILSGSGGSGGGMFGTAVRG